MRRKIYAQLLDWKQNRQGKTALLVEGARRIGKSYIIEEFAKNEYDTYILIDFNEEDEDVRNIFREHLSTLICSSYCSRCTTMCRLFRASR